MAHRDIPKTAVWADEIPVAIDNCKLFVLVFTPNANTSKFVFKEVTYADDINKPILNFRIEDFTPAPKYRLYLNTVQAMDAFSPLFETHLFELIAVVRSLLPGAPALPTPAQRIEALPRQTLPSPRTETGKVAEPAVGATRMREKDGMIEVYIPAGEFIMGSSDGDDHEKPPHKVILDDFWIDQTPVTNAMFTRFLGERGNQAEDRADWYYPEFGRIKQVKGVWRVEDNFEQHPVVSVSWYGAHAYAQWVGAKLPTEAQWEKAARGTDRRNYPWGNTKPDSTLANYNQNVGTTTPVGSYPAGSSPYRLLDLAGNAWEWCADWYGGDYYAKSPPRNPQGPASGKGHVVRGGSWFNKGGYLRAAFRDRFNPIDCVVVLGFRCCRPA